MTATTKICSVLIAVMVVSGTSVLMLQHQAHLALRSERQLAQLQNDELAQLQKKNEGAEQQEISAGDLSALRADHAILLQLRSDLDALEKSRERPASAAVFQPTRMASDAWRNAGRETPSNTFQTVLWAARSDDLSVLANTLELTGNARTEAQKLFEGMSDSLKANYVSPEQLVTVLAARTIKLNAVTIVSEKGDADLRNLEVILSPPDAAPKPASFQFHRNDGDWRLVVPATAIENLAVALRDLSPVK